MRLTWSFFLAAFFFTWPFFVSADEIFPSKFHCSQVINEWLIKAGSTGNWRRQVDPKPGAKSFRTNTPILGVWIEAHFFHDGLAEFQRLTPEGGEEISWDSLCNEKSKKWTDLKKDSLDEKNTFTDKNLEQLMAKNPSGIIYIWSPGMVYSMDFYPQVKRVAEKLKIPLTVLMDPYFDKNEGAKKAKEFNMPFFDSRVESVELLMRDIGTHYPETIVYNHGKLGDERIVGVMTPDVFENEIQTSLKRLN